MKNDKKTDYMKELEIDLRHHLQNVIDAAKTRPAARRWLCDRMDGIRKHFPDMVEQVEGVIGDG